MRDKFEQCVFKGSIPFDLCNGNLDGQSFKILFLRKQRYRGVLFRVAQLAVPESCGGFREFLLSDLIQATLRFKTRLTLGQALLVDPQFIIFPRVERGEEPR